MHAITITEEKVYDFERDQEGLYGWMKVKENCGNYNI